MNFVSIFSRGFLSQALPLATVLAAFFSGSAKAQTEHSNQVQFNAKSGTQVMGFGWTNISASTLPPFSITSGQPWDGTVSSSTSGNDLQITVNAGRHETDGPADWFASALQGGAATANNSGGPLPNQLNFAFSGYMGLNGYLNNWYAVVIGQGSDGAGANNWWIGGPGFQNAGLYSVSTSDSAFNFMTTVNDALIEVVANYPGSSPVNAGNAAPDLILGTNSTPVSTNFTSGSNAYSATVVGSSPDSASNSLLISGDGTQLSNSGSLMIGASGSSNSMVISAGASVVNSNGYIGFNTNSLGNSVLVTGSNSSWSNAGYYLSVGAGGSGNSLVISNGGSVSVQNLYLGYNKSSTGNMVLVSGPDSSLTASGDIAVGAYGSHNSLVISNGATVTSGLYGDYGSGVGGAHGSNNSVIITGSGSRWNASDSNSQFVIGYSNSSTANTLLLSNGGTLSTITAALGAEGSSNNSVLISGERSLWTNRGTIVIGGNIDGVIHTNDSGLGGCAAVTIASGGSLISSNVILASGSNTAGILNIGTLGGSDSNVTFKTAALSFGSGAGILNFNQKDSFTLSNAVTGNGSVQVLGSGTTIMTSSNGYTGSTLTPGGVIGSGGVNVASHSGLQNDGVVGGSTVVNGTLGGNGGSFQNLSLRGGSTMDWNIISFTGSAGNSWDLLNASDLDLSSLTSSNGWNLNLLGNSGTGDGSDSYRFMFLRVTGSLTGFDASNISINASGLTLDGGLQGGTWSIVTNHVNGATELALTYAVPEPSTDALVGLAALTLLLVARRCSA